MLNRGMIRTFRSWSTYGSFNSDRTLCPCCCCCETFRTLWSLRADDSNVSLRKNAGNMNYRHAGRQPPTNRSDKKPGVSLHFATPSGPCGPVSPFGPAGPCKPGAGCPGGPWTPTGPRGPCGPISPFVPTPSTTAAATARVNSHPIAANAITTFLLLGNRAFFKNLLFRLGTTLPTSNKEPSV